MEMIFENREQAGKQLAQKLNTYLAAPNTIVLGIPRGGVPVAYQISKHLKLPLDIILSKKIGHPSNPEYAIGAVTENLTLVNREADVTEEYIKQEIARIRKQIAERTKLFRGNKPAIDFKNKNVIIADDGIATGNTLLITIEMLRKAGVSKIVVASPVVPQDRVGVIQSACDEFVYLYAAEYFTGVGAFYEDFEQVSDEEAAAYLK